MMGSGLRDRLRGGLCGEIWVEQQVGCQGGVRDGWLGGLQDMLSSILPVRLHSGLLGVLQGRLQGCTWVGLQGSWREVRLQG